MPELTMPDDPTYGFYYVLVLALAGEQYPMGSASALRDFQYEAIDNGSQATSITHGIDQIARGVLDQLEGAGGEAFRDFATTLGETAPELASLALYLGSSLGDFSRQTFELKTSLNIEMITMGFELFLALSIPGGAAFIPAILRGYAWLIKMIMNAARRAARMMDVPPPISFKFVRKHLDDGPPIGDRKPPPGRTNIEKIDGSKSPPPGGFGENFISKIEDFLTRLPTDRPDLSSLVKKLDSVVHKTPDDLQRILRGIDGPAGAGAHKVTLDEVATLKKKMDHRLELVELGLEGPEEAFDEFGQELLTQMISMGADYREDGQFDVRALGINALGGLLMGGMAAKLKLLARILPDHIRHSKHTQGGISGISEVGGEAAMGALFGGDPLLWGAALSGYLGTAMQQAADEYAKETMADLRVGALNDKLKFEGNVPDSTDGGTDQQTGPGADGLDGLNGSDGQDGLDGLDVPSTGENPPEGSEINAPVAQEIAAPADKPGDPDEVDSGWSDTSSSSGGSDWGDDESDWSGISDSSGDTDWDDNSEFGDGSDSGSDRGEPGSDWSDTSSSNGGSDSGEESDWSDDSGWSSDSESGDDYEPGDDYDWSDEFEPDNSDGDKHTGDRPNQIDDASDSSNTDQKPGSDGSDIPQGDADVLPESEQSVNNNDNHYQNPNETDNLAPPERQGPPETSVPEVQPPSDAIVGPDDSDGGAGGNAQIPSGDVRDRTSVEADRGPYADDGGGLPEFEQVIYGNSEVPADRSAPYGHVSAGPESTDGGGRATPEASEESKGRGTSFETAQGPATYGRDTFGVADESATNQVPRNGADSEPAGTSQQAFTPQQQSTAGGRTEPAQKTDNSGPTRTAPSPQSTTGCQNAAQSDALRPEPRESTEEGTRTETAADPKLTDEQQGLPVVTTEVDVEGGTKSADTGPDPSTDPHTSGSDKPEKSETGDRFEHRVPAGGNQDPHVVTEQPERRAPVDESSTPVADPDLEILYHDVRREVRAFVKPGSGDVDKVVNSVKRADMADLYAAVPTSDRRNQRDAAVIIAQQLVARNRAGLPGKGVGYEGELHGIGVRLPPGETADTVGDLVDHEYFTLTADTAPGPILEFVSKPIQAVDGDEGRSREDEAARVFEKVLNMLNIARNGARLGKIFESDEFSVSPEVEDYQIFHHDASNYVYPHYTVGIPLLGLSDFLELLKKKNRVVGVASRAASGHLDDALRVVKELSYPNFSDAETIALRGFLALSYTQVGAMVQRSISDKGLTKNYGAALSRMPLATIRSGLSERVRDWLDRNANSLADKFSENFKNYITGAESAENSSIIDLNKKIPARWFDDDSRPEGTIRDYLDNALRTNPRHTYSQNDALGVRTSFKSLDENPDDAGNSRLNPPLILLELRYFGAEYHVGSEYIRNTVHELVELSRAAYEKVKQWNAGEVRARGRKPLGSREPPMPSISEKAEQETIAWQKSPAAAGGSERTSSPGEGDAANFLELGNPEGRIARMRGGAPTASGQRQDSRGRYPGESEAGPSSTSAPGGRAQADKAGESSRSASGKEGQVPPPRGGAGESLPTIEEQPGQESQTEPHAQAERRADEPAPVRSLLEPSTPQPSDEQRTDQTPPVKSMIEIGEAAEAAHPSPRKRNHRPAVSLGGVGQTGSASGVEDVISDLRNQLPGDPDESDLGAIRQRLLNDTQSLHGGGDGESFLITVDGKRFDLRLRNDFHLGEAEGASDRTSAGEVHASRKSDEVSKRILKSIIDRTRTFALFAPISSLGAFVTAQGSVNITRPTTTHEVVTDNAVARTVEIAAPVQVRPAVVPVRVVAVSLTDPDGRVIARDRQLGERLRVPMTVPDGPSTRSADWQPTAGRPFPATVTEKKGVRLHPERPASYRGKALKEWGLFNKFAARLPKSLTRPGSSGRVQLEQILDPETIEKDLPYMEVTSDEENTGKGWVYAGTLVKRPNPFKGRMRTQRVILQKRAIVRSVAYDRDVNGATFKRGTEHRTDIAETTTASRQGGGKVEIGPRTETGVVDVAAGPAVGGAAERSHEHVTKNERSRSGTQVTTEQATRFVAVSDLQVRQVGMPDIIKFHRAVESYRWSSTAEARRAGIGPRDDAPADRDHGNKDNQDSERSSAPREPLGPTPLLDRAALEITGAGARIAEMITSTLRKVPGRRVHVGNSGFVVDANDAGVPGGRLSRKLADQVARGIEVQRRVSDESLGAGPVILPLHVEGLAHVYHAEFKVTRRVVAADARELVPSAPGSNTVHSAKNGAEFSPKASKSVIGGALVRVYMGFGGLFEIAQAKVVEARRESERSATTGIATRSETTAASGYLDENGNIQTGPFRVVEGTVVYEITGRAWVERKRLARMFRSARVTRSRPLEIAGGILKTPSVTVDYRTLIPERYLTIPELNAPRRDVLPRNVTRFDDVAINHQNAPEQDRLRRTQSDNLAGVVIARLPDGLEHIAESFKKVVRAVSRSPLEESQESRIEERFDPRYAETKSSMFSAPEYLDVSQAGTGDSGQRLKGAQSSMLLDPEKVGFIEFVGKTETVTGESTEAAATGDEWEVANGAKLTLLPLAGDPTSHTGSVYGTAGGLTENALTVVQAKLKREQARRREQSSAAVAARPPAKVYLVRGDFRTIQVAENMPYGKAGRNTLVKRRPGADDEFTPAWKRRAGRDGTPKTRAVSKAEQFDLEQMLVWATETEFQEMQRISEQEKQRLRTEPRSPEPAALGSQAPDTGQDPREQALSEPGVRWQQGLSRVAAPITLSGVIAELREGLVDSLGAEQADRLIRTVSARGTHDNYQDAERFLRDINGIFGNVSTSQAVLPLRLEDKPVGQTYELHVKAWKIGPPSPLESYPGTLTFTNDRLDVTKTADEAKWSHADVENIAIPFGTIAEQPGHSLTQPGYGLFGGGAWTETTFGSETRKASREDKDGSGRSVSISGLIRRDAIPFKLDISIKRKDAVFAGAERLSVVEVETVLEASLPPGLTPDQLGVTGDFAIQRRKVSEQDLREWHTVLGHLPAPNGTNSFVEGFHADFDRLVAAAEAAITSAGGTVSTTVKRHLLLTLAEMAMRDEFPDLVRDGMPLLLPAEVGIDLVLHGRSGDVARLLSPSARSTFGGNDSHTTERTHTTTVTSHANSIAAAPILGSGAPEWNLYKQPIASHAPASEEKAATGEGKAAAERDTLPPATAGQDRSKLSSSWLEDLDLRFVATPSAPPHRVAGVGKSVRFTRKRAVIVDVHIRNGVVIRRADRNDRIPEGLAEATRDVAAADKAWADVKRRLTGVTERHAQIEELHQLQARPRPHSQTEAARIARLSQQGIRPDDAESAAQTVRDAEATLGQAAAQRQTAESAYWRERARAYEGVVFKTAPDATISSATTERARRDDDLRLQQIAWQLLDSARSGHAPRVELRVLGDVHQEDTDAHLRDVLGRLDYRVGLAAGENGRRPTVGDIGATTFTHYVPADGPPQVEIWIDKGARAAPATTEDPRGETTATPATNRDERRGRSRDEIAEIDARLDELGMNDPSPTVVDIGELRAEQEALQDRILDVNRARLDDLGANDPGDPDVRAEHRRLSEELTERLERIDRILAEWNPDERSGESDEDSVDADPASWSDTQLGDFVTEAHSWINELDARGAEEAKQSAERTWRDRHGDAVPPRTPQRREQAITALAYATFLATDIDSYTVRQLTDRLRPWVGFAPIRAGAGTPSDTGSASEPTGGVGGERDRPGDIHTTAVDSFAEYEQQHPERADRIRLLVAEMVLVAADFDPDQLPESLRTIQSTNLVEDLLSHHLADALSGDGVQDWERAAREAWNGVDRTLTDAAESSAENGSAQGLLGIAWPEMREQLGRTLVDYGFDGFQNRWSSVFAEARHTLDGLTDRDEVGVVNAVATVLLPPPLELAMSLGERDRDIVDQVTRVLAASWYRALGEAGTNPSSASYEQLEAAAQRAWEESADLRAEFAALRDFPLVPGASERQIEDFTDTSRWEREVNRAGELMRGLTDEGQRLVSAGAASLGEPAGPLTPNAQRLRERIARTVGYRDHARLGRSGPPGVAHRRTELTENLIADYRSSAGSLAPTDAEIEAFERRWQAVLSTGEAGLDRIGGRAEEVREVGRQLLAPLSTDLPQRERMLHDQFVDVVGATWYRRRGLFQQPLTDDIRADLESTRIEIARATQRGATETDAASRRVAETEARWQGELRAAEGRWADDDRDWWLAEGRRLLGDPHPDATQPERDLHARFQTLAAHRWFRAVAPRRTDERPATDEGLTQDLLDQFRELRAPASSAPGVFGEPWARARERFEAHYARNTESPTQPDSPLPLLQRLAASQPEQRPIQPELPAELARWSQRWRADLEQSAHRAGSFMPTSAAASLDFAAALLPPLSRPAGAHVHPDLVRDFYEQLAGMMRRPPIDITNPAAARTRLQELAGGAWVRTAAHRVYLELLRSWGSPGNHGAFTAALPVARRRLTGSDLWLISSGAWDAQFNQTFGVDPAAVDGLERAVANFESAYRTEFERGERFLAEAGESAQQWRTEARRLLAAGAAGERGPRGLADGERDRLLDRMVAAIAERLHSTGDQGRPGPEVSQQVAAMTADLELLREWPGHDREGVADLDPPPDYTGHRVTDDTELGPPDSDEHAALLREEAVWEGVFQAAEARVPDTDDAVDDESEQILVRVFDSPDPGNYPQDLGRIVQRMQVATEAEALVHSHRAAADLEALLWISFEPYLPAELGDISARRWEKVRAWGTNRLAELTPSVARTLRREALPLFGRVPRSGAEDQALTVVAAVLSRRNDPGFARRLADRLHALIEADSTTGAATSDDAVSGESGRGHWPDAGASVVARYVQRLGAEVIDDIYQPEHSGGDPTGDGRETAPGEPGDLWLIQDTDGLRGIGIRWQPRTRTGRGADGTLSPEHLAGLQLLATYLGHRPGMGVRVVSHGQTEPEVLDRTEELLRLRFQNYYPGRPVPDLPITRETREQAADQPGVTPGWVEIVLEPAPTRADRSPSGAAGAAPSTRDRRVAAAGRPRPALHRETRRLQDVRPVAEDGQPSAAEPTVRSMELPGGMGVAFPRAGEAATLARADTDPEAFTVLAHHDNDGWEVTLGDDRTETLDAAGMHRVLTSRRSYGALLTSSRVVLASCRIGAARYRDRMARLEDLLHADGFRGRLEGARTRVEVRADGEVRYLGDDEQPQPGSVVLDSDSDVDMHDADSDSDADVDSDSDSSDSDSDGDVGMHDAGADEDADPDSDSSSESESDSDSDGGAEDESGDDSDSDGGSDSESDSGSDVDMRDTAGPPSDGEVMELDGRGPAGFDSFTDVTIDSLSDSLTDRAAGARALLRANDDVPEQLRTVVATFAQRWAGALMGPVPDAGTADRPRLPELHRQVTDVLAAEILRAEDSMGEAVAVHRAWEVTADVRRAFERARDRESPRHLSASAMTELRDDPDVRDEMSRLSAVGRDPQFRTDGHRLLAIPGEGLSPREQELLDDLAEILGYRSHLARKQRDQAAADRATEALAGRLRHRFTELRNQGRADQTWHNAGQRLQGEPGAVHQLIWQAHLARRSLAGLPPNQLSQAQTRSRAALGPIREPFNSFHQTRAHLHELLGTVLAAEIAVPSDARRPVFGAWGATEDLRTQVAALLNGDGEQRVDIEVPYAITVRRGLPGSIPRRLAEWYQQWLGNIQAGDRLLADEQPDGRALMRREAEQLLGPRPDPRPGRGPSPDMGQWLWERAVAAVSYRNHVAADAATFARTLHTELVELFGHDEGPALVQGRQSGVQEVLGALDDDTVYQLRVEARAMLGVLGGPDAGNERSAVHAGVYRDLVDLLAVRLRQLPVPEHAWQPAAALLAQLEAWFNGDGQQRTSFDVPYRVAQRRRIVGSLTEQVARFETSWDGVLRDGDAYLSRRVPWRADRERAQADQLLGGRPDPRAGWGPSAAEQQRLWQRMQAAVAQVLVHDQHRAATLATNLRAEFDRLHGYDELAEVSRVIVAEVSDTHQEARGELAADPESREGALRFAEAMVGPLPPVVPGVGPAAAEQQRQRAMLVDIVASHLVLVENMQDAADARMQAWALSEDLRRGLEYLRTWMSSGPADAAPGEGYLVDEETITQRFEFADPGGLDRAVEHVQRELAEDALRGAELIAQLSRRDEDLRTRGIDSMQAGQLVRDERRDELLRLIGVADHSPAVILAMCRQWSRLQIATLSGDAVGNAIAEFRNPADWLRAEGARLMGVAEHELPGAPAADSPEGRRVELLRDIARVVNASPAPGIDQADLRDRWEDVGIATRAGAALDETISEFRTGFSHMFDQLAIRWEERLAAAEPFVAATLEARAQRLLGAYELAEPPAGSGLTGQQAQSLTGVSEQVAQRLYRMMTAALALEIHQRPTATSEHLILAEQMRSGHVVAEEEVEVPGFDALLTWHRPAPEHIADTDPVPPYTADDDDREPGEQWLAWAEQMLGPRPEVNPRTDSEHGRIAGGERGRIHAAARAANYYDVMLHAVALAGQDGIADAAESLIATWRSRPEEYSGT